ncbi:sigma-54-dependent transcriptional regulator [Williamwhitmania taraxaci]|uniref:DNA-binding transcriptional response regulator, NtrC family, contains REC, AAA-type ATPase, and a Fis-type DNA-binding domains n=1 Tax=Williamwhitmania taraxaci TaxID=1640674 RepID=A0A1G6LJ89_9BACT|nr:sigma-54 dependent transcriptional regulator [Williamwhitmania taraxaci]SDC43321.1 DNA-binding transcriptional response regulator, NtrC family, contains REC, AAA-type ATPase, and a Fis-type DNA-binding domains [Williamwhitmania taraxaci]
MQDLSILVLDDEKAIRVEIVEFLTEEGYSLFEAERPSQAFSILEEIKVDVLILDLQLPEMDGLSVLRRVKEDYPSMEVIMITGHGDMDAVIQAMRLGAMEFFTKPFRLLDMKAAIQRSRRFVELNSQLKEANLGYALLSKELQENVGHQIIGTSLAMKRVVDLMERVAKSDTTSVLITGESGTGKELVARGIHFLSNRKKNLFCAVNCSAIPDSLFESEFFGHKKGAFTGAMDEKEGWFEIASGGTLFLDEVVEMLPLMQAKLLRVLEDRKVQRIGSHQQIDVDVRIIAATNKNIALMTEENRFRSDLFYRLNSFIINLPALRERREDIPILFDYYLRFFCSRFNKNVPEVDAQVYKALSQYSFPGNVRELRNMVERAIILTDGNKIRARDFMLNDVNIEEVPTEIDEMFDLEELEKRTIIKALEKTGFKKVEAAIMLNITRQSLDRRLEKYNLFY